MRKIAFLFLLFATFAARADEGMWLPSLIGEEKFTAMKTKGLKLSAEDIYSINWASLKDAIVRFGSGCTGELISDEGLLLTNYHCGYGTIQEHSSVENNYLAKGFQAMNRDEELPNNGLTATRLVRMDDVTEQILQGVSDNMTEQDRRKKINENKKQIILDATKDTRYTATIESLYSGNQYFIFINEVFEDIRLVFAPPAAIGKFGGDTDNWVWPRHTGDFCLFRIYADRDNKPAQYSMDNVPYLPRKSFTISLKGINDGDFTMVYGFPGRTAEYLFSDAVQYIVESNPHKIKMRTMRLNIMEEEMKKDPTVRIRYAAKQASVANAWKKWQGETKGLIRLQTVAKKQTFEAEFARRASGNKSYESLPTQFSTLYKNIEKYAFARDYYNEAFGAVELLRFAGQFAVLADTAAKSKDSINSYIQTLQKESMEFFKNYSIIVDQKIFEALMNEYSMQISDEFKPEALQLALKKYGNITNWASVLYENSMFVSSEKIETLLQTDANMRIEMLTNDPAFALYLSFRKMYEKSIAAQYSALSADIEQLYRRYMKGMMEMQPDRMFYPDANSTLRIAYGTIGGYAPSDGVLYAASTSVEGIMQKDNPDVYDYNVPQRLRDLYHAKDFGRWATNGSVPVAFVANNHTTGGNSGSPVLNAKGELVGLNFDRTWESTMSDIEYDAAVCRNIALDVRFILFIVDKFAGAGYLLNEMKFSK